MTTTQELAEFVQDASYANLTAEAEEEVKKRILDSVGIAVGALGAEPVAVVRRTVDEVGGDGCRLWGSTTESSPPQAAMYNTALTRYLDYMDSFLAPGETPHPSDNIGSVVATGEYAGRPGKELLTAIAIAYEVQGELAWNAPVRDKGWDHVTHTVISAVCGAARMLGLDVEATRNAIGIAGTAHNALRVTRTGGINEWKGIASANAARNAVYAALLARNGMEGPRDLFEGQKGWKQVIAGEFEVSLDPEFGHMFDVMTKKYVAETYAQSAVEAVIELADREDISPGDVESIHLDTFAGAKLIIGGGEGDRHEVHTKAQADHSLPYMLAVALLDRELTSAQYDSERLNREDVQRLLRTVTVEEDPELTTRFERGEMPAIVDIQTADGQTYHIEKDDFPGHPNNPMPWQQVEGKFLSMAADRYDDNRLDEIIDVVHSLEDRDVTELVAVLN